MCDHSYIMTYDLTDCFSADFTPFPQKSGLIKPYHKYTIVRKLWYYEFELISLCQNALHTMATFSTYYCFFSGILYDAVGFPWATTFIIGSQCLGSIFLAGFAIVSYCR